MEKRLLGFLYKWDRLEKKNDIDIIDFDLVRQGQNFPGAFKNRKQAQEELLTLIQEYSSARKHDFICAKLTACLNYLRALMGEKIGFEEYILHTMGLKPRFIPENALEDQLKYTVAAYKEIGYQYNKKGVEKYRKQNQLSKKEIRDSFKRFQDKVLPNVMDWLGLELGLEYKIKFVDRDAYWVNWISTDKKGDILLQYNLNRPHKWVKGSTEYLVFHEICAHALQALSWKEQIKRGRLHPLAGLTTVFGPEQFLIEGIAESLSCFYPGNPFSLFGLVSTNTDNLYWLVLNNAHIMANTGLDREKIIRFIQSYLPHKNRRDIIKNIKERTGNPLFRTYQYIYGIALYYHQQIASQLTKKQRRDYVLDIYKNIYIPQQILEQYNLETLKDD